VNFGKEYHITTVKTSVWRLPHWTPAALPARPTNWTAH
jgi:hypothetical protein